MNVLSLFDGMSCGRIALDRIDINISKYYASEVDKYAIQVSTANYPDNINLGTVLNINVNTLDRIDLLIGGSPCQSFSFAGKQNGMSTKCKQETTIAQYLLLKMMGFEFEGQSYLFWEYIRILTDIRKINPNVLFMLENVKMGKKWQDILSKTVGCEPTLINSSLVSGQNRKRLYWTNIPGVTQPIDKGILLKDVIENFKGAVIKNRQVLQERNEKSMCLDANYWKGVDNHGQRTMIIESDFDYLNQEQLNKLQLADTKHTGSTRILFHRKNFRRNTQVYGIDGKTECLDTGGGGGRGAYTIDDMDIRKLTPLECERLQTVPENYTNHVSNSQRYKMLGNGWTIDVVAHIFSGIKLYQMLGLLK